MLRKNCVCDLAFSSKTGVPLWGHPQDPAYVLNRFTAFSPLPLRGRGNRIILLPNHFGFHWPGVHCPRPLEIWSLGWNHIKKFFKKWFQKTLGKGVGGDKKHNVGFSITSWTYNSVKYCLWAINETHVAPGALMLHAAGAGHCIQLSFGSALLITFLFLFVLEDNFWGAHGVTVLLGRTGLELQAMLDIATCVGWISLGARGSGRLSSVWVDENSPQSLNL